MERYPVAGEELHRQAIPSDSSPGSTSHGTLGSSSGSAGARILLGVRARNEEGMVEVVPPSVHRKLRKTRTMIMPADTTALHPSTSASTTCGICLTDEMADPVSFDCGTHVFCKDCMRRHCQERLKRGLLPDCPADGCKAEAGVESLSALLSAREFEEYLLVSLRATRRFRTCPRADCGTAVYIEEDATRQTNRGVAFEPGLASAVRCPQCKNSFCMVCAGAAHPKHTCEEARRKADKRGQRQLVLDGYLPQGLAVKPCPRCGASICKSSEDDCDHMTCSECKKEFCWTCFEDRDVILHHGNHYHTRSCRHYAAYDGPMEFLPNKCTECHRTGRPCRPLRK